MIPGTAIPTTRLTVDDSVQPVKPSQAVTDILSEFRPGERLVATIQSQLPNGTYRALIAQRDVTLALPFSARAGDSLDLEVIETEGRLTFAATTRSETPGEKPSVTTTLSRTAQLIGNLTAQTGEEGEVAPATLNGGRPIAATPPHDAGQLAPLLQKAINSSGLFYEAHQAAWIAGRTSTDALREEPQGRIPVPAHPIDTTTPGPASTPGTTAESRTSMAADVRPGAAGETAVRTTPAPPGLPAELAPVVQQQLNALATNVFAWQGMPWPGQTIEWEIVDEEARRGGGDAGEEAQRWQTTLRLSLPSLGAVDAVIGLRGDQVELKLVAGNEATRAALLAGGDRLRRKYDAAGLQLATLGVVAPDEAAS